MVPNSAELQEAIDIVYKMFNLGMTAILNSDKHFYPETWHYHEVPEKSRENLNIDVYAGATKGVIVPLDMDFVIKFDYVSKPYCARECENYKAAEKAGLEDFFPYTSFLCRVDDVDFYIQERAECGDSSNVPELAYNSLKARYDSNGDEYVEDYLWDELDEMNADDVVDLIFENTELTRFVWERRINDLHMANFGTIYGRNVIIDFSGYGNNIWKEFGE